MGQQTYLCIPVARGRGSGEVIPRACLLLLLAAGLIPAEQPDFSFGVIADVQYADQATAGKRDYRATVAKLETCVAALNRERPAFVVQVGDLVDSGSDNLNRILPVFDRIAAPKHHVLGNHDVLAMRTKFSTAPAYYDFEVKHWHFIVVNGMDVSVRDPAGRAELERLRAAGQPNAQEWNGGLGEKQREWLHHRLHDATAVGERAIVFCHFPVLPQSSSPQHELWDWRETLAILKDEPATVAWINGHDHRGGYAVDTGIHYITVKGMVESEPVESCRVVDVYSDRLVLRGAGQTGGQTLRLRPQ